MNKNILYLIQQTGMLMQMPRSHNKLLGNTFDTVASHSHHMAIIAYCITRMEGLTHQDGMKAMVMATLHDIAEARTGDFDFTIKHYCTKDEDKAIEDTFEGIEFGKDLINELHEYEERESLVAKCVKDADMVEQMYQEWVLMWQGNKLAQNWFDRKYEKLIVPTLRTESAKKIIESMKESNPHEWWMSKFIDNSYKAEHLAGKK